MASLIISSGVRETTDNVVYVAAEIGWRTLKSFTVALGSGFGERTTGGENSTGLFVFPKGQARSIMFPRPVTVYLEPPVHRMGAELAKTVLQITFYIVGNLVQDGYDFFSS